MTTRTVLLTACAALLSIAFVGCRSPLQELIRAQSPPVTSAVPPSGEQSISYPHATGHPPGTVVYEGHNGQYTTSYPCEDGQCGNGGWGHLGTHHYKKPHGYHIYNFDYSQPKGLVYPPRNQPAGVTFYPYYTLRGPTDFFYEGP